MQIQVTLYCPECQSAKVKKMVKKPNRANKIFAVKHMRKVLRAAIAVYGTESGVYLEKPAVFQKNFLTISRHLS